MDKELKNDFNKLILNKQFVKYVKLVLIAVLLVIEILVCAQYSAHYIEKGGIWYLVAVVLFCAVLAGLDAVHAFLIKQLGWHIAFCVFESIILLVLCVLTGNSYLSTLYCIMLTQYYISLFDLKSNAVLFGVSCGLYVISFVCGWMAVNHGVSAYEAFVQILGDCVFGVFILGMHFVIVNFLIKFYSNNVQLRLALKEADESREKLKEVSDQLLNSAVFEERNRIAKDIHDNAGHSMTTVIMQTEAAKLLMDTDPDGAKNAVISANIQAKNALEQMRESVHLLAGRPQTRSLKEEIEEIIAQTMDGTGLKVRCDIAEVSVTQTEIRFFCNSLKECLANGIRHGRATAFYIELKKVFSDICLLISDNGCGVEGQFKEGFGIKGIREKAEALGGSLLISCEAGEGFEIEISLPAEREKKEEDK